jgi:hypothetical protein
MSDEVFAWPVLPFYILLRQAQKYYKISEPQKSTFLVLQAVLIDVYQLFQNMRV